MIEVKLKYFTKKWPFCTLKTICFIQKVSEQYNFFGFKQNGQSCLQFLENEIKVGVYYVMFYILDKMY